MLASLPRFITLGVLVVAACAAPQEDTISRTETETPAVSFTDADFTCLREAVYYEAAANSLSGQRAVANVILNRAEDPRFPNSVCGVVADGCQFSYRCDGKPEVFGDQVKLANATRATEVALANPQEDVTDGALFFHAKWMKPGWFATLRRTVALGGNIFYR
ncbi:hypothetical protein GE300_16305 [Rhodobacteraceae bacterium 2CG4]|uniref:Cell wall hydrolase SleB domain-containing protein n=1 Tax=Halovulum marinum TaxID=2662447 RepID=A0A6L5Z548_9RHOB|nr:cell wall hydrolase [Halovulum marinum]MSU91152.1 hypothetical protein [Halovulum marinum]